VRVEIGENHAENEAQHLPKAEETARAAQERYNTVQRDHLLAQQQLQLAETQRGHTQNNLQQIGGTKVALVAGARQFAAPQQRSAGTSATADC
jgi:chromosome segregation protein